MFLKFARYDGDPQVLLGSIRASSLNRQGLKRNSSVKTVSAQKKVKLDLVEQDAFSSPPLDGRSLEKTDTERTVVPADTPKAKPSSLLVGQPPSTSCSTSSSAATVKPIAHKTPVQQSTSALARTGRMIPKRILNRPCLVYRELLPPEEDYLTTLSNKRSEIARKHRGESDRLNATVSHIRSPEDADRYVANVNSALMEAIESFKKEVDDYVDTEIRKMWAAMATYREKRIAFRQDFDRLTTSPTTIGFSRATKIKDIHDNIAREYRHLRRNLADFDIRTLDQIQKLKNEVAANFTPKREETFNKIFNEYNKFSPSQESHNNIKKEEIKKIKETLYNAAAKIIFKADTHRNNLLSYIEKQGMHFSTSTINQEFSDIENDLDQDYKIMNQEYIDSNQEGRLLSRRDLINTRYDQTAEEARTTLGIKRGCSDSALRKAYLKLAQENHPDKHMDREAEYTERFQKIEEAYNVLISK